MESKRTFKNLNAKTLRRKENQVFYNLTGFRIPHQEGTYSLKNLSGFAPLR